MLIITESAQKTDYILHEHRVIDTHGYNSSIYTVGPGNCRYSAAGLVSIYIYIYIADVCEMMMQRIEMPRWRCYTEGKAPGRIVSFE